MELPQILIRSATQDDLEILWDFLAIAAYEPSAATAKCVPIVAAHLAGWRRETDFGVVAELRGAVIGAAWARQFSLDEQPAFYVNEHTPEVSIGVKQPARGQGVGAVLLQGLKAEAFQRKVDLCLNVRDTNPAVRLYQRVGFRRVRGAEIRNRVGGLSFGMFLACVHLT